MLKKMQTRPRIGITVSQTREPSLARHWNGTAISYARGVHVAGGLPVLLPVLSGTESAQLAHLDGVLFSGGVDVDPTLFGADHEAGLGEVDAERDTFEIELYRLTRLKRVPVLGICRGFQVINVAEGGTLHQHLPGVGGVWADHRQTALPPTLGHRVRVAEGTQLKEAYPSGALRVNSYHHQGVKDVAPGLTVSAWAPDGLVEALEGEAVIAVQWHPELLFEHHPEHLEPFRALVQMCLQAQVPASR
jgi:putative glutamine amidotransferase